MIFSKFQNKTLIKYFIALLALCAVLILFSACTSTKEPPDNSVISPEPQPQPQETYYSVTYIASKGGTIEGKSEQTVKEGENAEEVTAVPYTGYYFVKWSDEVATATRQDINVTSEITVTAEFEKITYTVQYLSGEGGTISGNANQQVKYSENAEEVTAVRDEGYYFVKWSDGVTTPTRQDANVTSEIIVTAEFEKITYTVQYLAGEGGTISGNANQQVKYGENAEEVTAVSNDGYKFIGWSDGVSTVTRQDSDIVSDLSVIAEFKLEEFAGGIGTQFDPYLIENYEQFKDIYKYPFAHYKLISDLDLSGIIYEPYFTDIYRFEGTFDGNGRTVKNLAVNSDGNFPSLFGFIGAGGIVKNLNIENADITAINFNTLQHNAQYCIGILAGVSFGTHENINVSGNIHGDTFQYDQITIGGLIGMAYGNTVNCNSDVNITVSGIERLNNTGTTMPYVFGGLVGVYNSLGTKLNGCFAKGSLTVSVIETNITVIAGGLVGYYFTERNSSSIISDCQTNILINGDQMVAAGGFIGDLEVASNSELQINNCSVHGAITAVLAGGFINESSSYGGKLVISYCYTDNDIYGYKYAAGFSRSCRSSATSDFSILNCYVTGNINAPEADNSTSMTASGFCFQAYYVELFQCYFAGTATASNAIGFIFDLSDSLVNQCFCSGTLSASLRGATILDMDDTILKNFYSDCDIIITNTDPDSIARTFAAGLVVGAKDSQIINCYYSGSLRGSVYTAGQFGFGYIVGAFIGYIDNTQIDNCHVLFADKSYAKDVIFENNNSENEVIDLTIYEEEAQMYKLANKLNKEDEEIWVDVENDFPILKFSLKN